MIPMLNSAKFVVDEYTDAASTFGAEMLPLKVPPAALIPLVAFNSPLTDTDEPVKVSGDPTALTSIKPTLLSITILQPLVM